MLFLSFALASRGVDAPGHVVSPANEVYVLFDALSDAVTETTTSVTRRSLASSVSSARDLAVAGEYTRADEVLATVESSVTRAAAAGTASRASASAVSGWVRLLRSWLELRATGSTCETGRGWRQTWADEFNGPVAGDEACYDQSTTPAQCMEYYWSNADCPTVHAGLAGLNKCDWSILNYTNFMTNGLPYVNNFTPAEVSVGNGVLDLSASATPEPTTGYDCGVEDAPYHLSEACPIAAGGLWGNAIGDVDGFTQLHGRFEVRARLPVGPGSWPAHWLLPDAGGWPDAGEIDIMEAVGWKPTIMGGNYHDGYPLSSTTRLHLSKGQEFDAENDAFSTEFHVFATEWDTDAIRYFMDGICYHEVLDGESITGTIYDNTGAAVGTQVGTIEVPTTAFHWILNTTVANMNPDPNHAANPDPDTFAPLHHLIDYVRVYEECDLSDTGCARVPNQVPWAWQWGNGGSGTLALWNLHDGDRFLPGDFDGDGADELLAFAEDTWVHLMERASTWSWVWGNQTSTPGVPSGTIALWNLRPTDTYLAGDFRGVGRDELLAIDVGGWAHLMTWNGAAWQWLWGNQTSTPGIPTGQLGLWYIHEGDTYTVGDFDGDGDDEVFSTSLGGWAHLTEWGGSAWSWQWGNAGTGQVALWYLNPGDRFLAVDSDGDGADELLAISAGGWAHLMAWDGAGWTWRWGNAGNGRIQLREHVGTEAILAADWYADGTDALWVVDPDGAVAWLIHGAEVGTWQWMREDEGQAGLWYLHPGDQFVAGDFDGDGRASWLAVSTGGWVHEAELSP